MGAPLDRLPDIVPVLPLPDTVFFPKTMLPLHIFEQRYRTMLQDAVTGDRLIVVALSRNRDFHSVATVGRLHQVEKLDDGRSNIVLAGLERVTLREVASTRPYRLAQIEAHPEQPADPTDEAVQRAKLELLATLDYLRRELYDGNSRSIWLDEQMPIDVAVNTVCTGLPVHAGIRQALLEENDLLGRQRRVAQRINEVLELVLRNKQTENDVIGPDMLN